MVAGGTVLGDVERRRLLREVRVRLGDVRPDKQALRSILLLFTQIRKLLLRHVSLPRPTFLAVKAVEDGLNLTTGFYYFNYAGF